MFPDVSSTVQVTLVVPELYGDDPSFVVLSTAQLSPVVGEPNDATTAVQSPAS